MLFSDFEGHGSETRSGDIGGSGEGEFERVSISREITRSSWVRKCNG